MSFLLPLQNRQSDVVLLGCARCDGHGLVDRWVLDGDEGQWLHG
jgi:hypothetical protein